MIFMILRVFIVIAIGLGLFRRLPNITQGSDATGWALLIGIPLGAIAIVAIDVMISRKRLDVISAVYFGLIVGLFLAYIGGLALTPFLMISDPELLENVRAAVQLLLAPMLCYTCISLLMQTRTTSVSSSLHRVFQGGQGAAPTSSTSVVIDGRIADVVETNADSQLVMPRFAITELQAIADSSDRLRRSRGAGLDILNRLRNNPEVDLKIFDRDLPEFAGQPVDLKLVTLAKHLEGKLITNDYNLNKVARLHGVGVINLNDLANALKPVFLPGEHIEVRIVKAGEEPGQGVGYLDDGTMVVVENGRDYIKRNVQIAVTSVLQTSAGRMVFGRFETVSPDQ